MALEDLDDQDPWASQDLLEQRDCQDYLDRRDLLVVLVTLEQEGFLEPRVHLASRGLQVQLDFLDLSVPLDKMVCPVNKEQLAKGDNQGGLVSLDLMDSLVLLAKLATGGRPDRMDFLEDKDNLDNLVRILLGQLVYLVSVDFLEIRVIPETWDKMVHQEELAILDQQGVLDRLDSLDQMACKGFLEHQVPLETLDFLARQETADLMDLLAFLVQRVVQDSLAFQGQQAFLEDADCLEQLEDLVKQDKLDSLDKMDYQAKLELQVVQDFKAQLGARVNLDNLVFKDFLANVDCLA